MKKNNPLCVLIYPKTAEIEWANPEVPFSTFFLGSYLHEHQVNVKLFDQRIIADNEILNYITSEPVTHVGFSVMTGPQLIYAIKLSKIIKHLCSEIKIIWGGMHVTLSPETALNQSFIDYIVFGEGEETLLELLQSTEGKHIKGVLRANDSLKNLKERNLLDFEKLSLEWSLIDTSKYIFLRHGRRSIAFVTSRGCSFKCTFCCHSIIENRWRYWSVEKVRTELEKVLAFDISYLFFWDDNIAIRAKRFAEICDILKEKDIYWHASFHISLVNEKNMDRFHNSSMIYLGAESGSQKILDYLKKGLKVERIYSAAKILKNREVGSSFSWIIGFPKETKEDVMVTIKAVQDIEKIAPEADQRIKVFTPYPGSLLFEEAVSLGYQPPKTLEGWGEYTREQCTLPYIKNPWWYKAISYVTFFVFFSGNETANKPIFWPIITFFKLLSRLRWRFNFYSLPIEFFVLEKLRYFLITINKFNFFKFKKKKKQTSDHLNHKQNPLKSSAIES